MMNPTAPLLRKKKMTNPPPLPLVHPPSSSSTTFSSLPDEIVMDCLARISKSDYKSICLVSKNFNSLLSSPHIYESRSRIGTTEPRLYVCLWLLSPNHRWFTLSEINDELSFILVKLAPSCPPNPFDEITIAVGSEIYQIGGTIKDPLSTDVHVLDCRTHTWRRGPNLTEGRVSAKCWYLDGKIYVIGGEKRTNLGEVLDVKTQTWKPLPFPNGEHDCYRAAVFEGKFYVSFTNENIYAFDPKEERWIRDESKFLELEPSSVYPDRWCFIDKVMFTVSYYNQYKWYNSHCKKWTRVCGLDDFYVNRPCNQGYDYTVRLANYGGKLVVMWHTEQYESQKKTIWCTVISLEKRLTHLGLEIWGKVERSNSVLQVPNICSPLCFVSASV